MIIKKPPSEGKQFFDNFKVRYLDTIKVDFDYPEVVTTEEVVILIS